jgi:hypothetical protein
MRGSSIDGGFYSGGTYALLNPMNETPHLYPAALAVVNHGGGCHADVVPARGFPLSAPLSQAVKIVAWKRGKSDPVRYRT